jgi:hypothetical protein
MIIRQPTSESSLPRRYDSPGVKVANIESANLYCKFLSVGLCSAIRTYIANWYNYRYGSGFWIPVRILGTRTYLHDVLLHTYEPINSCGPSVGKE